jgi:DNA-binding LacI/PurR family transcriptional regulator
LVVVELADEKLRDEGYSLQVPAQLSLVGFDDIPLSVVRESTGPPPRTVRRAS